MEDAKKVSKLRGQQRVIYTQGQCALRYASVPIMKKGSPKMVKQRFALRMHIKSRKALLFILL